MIIPLYSGINNESWREQLQDLDIQDEYELNALTNDLVEYVWDDLMDQGHQPIDNQQKRLVICQKAEAQAIVDNAIAKAKERIRKKIKSADELSVFGLEIFDSLERERIRKSLKKLRLEFQELKRQDT